MTVKAEIVHEKAKCIGCGTCVAIQPKHWTMEGSKADLVGGQDVGNDTKTLTQDMSESDFDLTKQAGESCPVNCIHVKKK